MSTTSGRSACLGGRLPILSCLVFVFPSALVSVSGASPLAFTAALWDSAWECKSRTIESETKWNFQGRRKVGTVSRPCVTMALLGVDPTSHVALSWFRSLQNFPLPVCTTT